MLGRTGRVLLATVSGMWWGEMFECRVEKYIKGDNDLKCKNNRRFKDQKQDSQWGTL